MTYEIPSALLARHTETYNALAPEYERRVPQKHAAAGERVRRLGRFVVSNGSVLEVGCGVGLNLLWLARHGFSCTGIDCSEEMVELARRRNPGVDVVKGDFLSYDLTPPFDAIVADAVIHLFPEPGVRAFMTKCRGLLTPSGVLYLATTVGTISCAGWKVKSDFPGGLMRYRQEWTRQEFLALLTNGGWSILDYWESVDAQEKHWMSVVTRST
ncbi:class I SAM-dependent methyltransferase [Streptomyces sp. NPDC127113]|uniref:class I SAM-dependent methyltransferase n=1 Tax=unclassified Streptomyces TaxID=2593676 RepID=UPI0033A43B4E